MIPEYRKHFNKEFSDEKYQKVYVELTERAGAEPLFRLSESPVFLPQDFKQKLEDACKSIINQIKKMPDADLRKAVPEKFRVPNDTEKPHFLAIDFAICKNENDETEPQLIELQAFPSLFAFQKEYQEVFREVYPFLSELEGSMPKEAFINYFKKIIIGDENLENVILLEIFPEKQKTNIDFYLTKKYLGIETVCLTKIIKKNKKLFYEKNGRVIPINRIYNRVIFDELETMPDLKLPFDFREKLEVKWITHPNWFFKISKYILPTLQHQFVPKSYFLNEFPKDEKPENFVLKPLFSFAGSGVNLHPTSQEISEIQDKENYIMQRKVEYAPLFEDLNGDLSKAEIRVLYLWDEAEENPVFVDYIVRMTKAEMANVGFNKKDAVWIGSSAAFFDKV